MFYIKERLMPVLILPILLLSASCDDTEVIYQPYHLGLEFDINEIKYGSVFKFDSNDNIYHTDEKSSLKCINIKGEVNWTFKCDNVRISGLSFSDSLIYILTNYRNNVYGNNELYALNKMGKLLWEHPFENLNFYFNLVGSDGHIYCLSWEKLNYAKPLSELIDSPPQRRCQGILTISPSADTNFYNWPYDFKPSYRTVNSDNNLLICDYKTGKIIEMAPKGKFRMIYSSETKNIIAYKTIFDSDYIYTLTTNNEVISLDYNGNIKWCKKVKCDEKKYSDDGLAVTSEYLYFNNAYQDLYKLDKLNGSIAWRINVGDIIHKITHIVPFNDGRLLVAGHNAQMLILNEHGKTIWKYQLYESGNIKDIFVSTQNEIVIHQNNKILKFTHDENQIIPEKKPVSPPQTIEEAREEIVSFLLNHGFGYVDKFQANLENVIEYNDSTINLDGQYGLFITYCQIKERKERINDTVYSSYHPDYNNLIKIWFYSDSSLLEIGKQKSVLDKYYGFDSNHRFRNSLLEIGIISITDDFKQAEVLVDFTGGPLMGHGSHKILARSPSGKWWIVSSTRTWVS